MKRSVKEKIELLERVGYDVQLEHKRNLVRRYPNKMDQSLMLSPKGGETVVTTIGRQGKRVFTAQCSEYDNYNKSIGAHIALGRALKGLGLE